MRSSLPIVVRLVWGVLLVAAPGPVLGALGGTHVEVGSVRVMRVLGGRHLTEAVLELRYPATRRWGVAVDVLHAGTAIVFAVGSPRWRRAASADAIVAIGFAGMGARRLRRPDATGSMP